MNYDGPMTFDPEHPELGWTPSVPLPFYVWWWKRCECGKRFFTNESYTEHWLHAHVKQAAPKQDGEAEQTTSGKVS